jgi:hypothetical protein
MDEELTTFNSLANALGFKNESYRLGHSPWLNSSKTPPARQSQKHQEKTPAASVRSVKGW